MEKETLKSLRAKAKDLRSKVSSAPLSKATPDQLRSEIVMLERAVKAEEKAKEKKALKASMEVEKKKITTKPIVPATMAPPKVTAQRAPQTKDSAEEREKALAKREKELAKKEKLLLSYKPPPRETMLYRMGGSSQNQMRMETGEDTSDSDDY